jgi:hypothetical protein
MSKRLLSGGFTALAVSAVVAAVGLSGSAPASAAGPATCQFNGLTSQLTPIPVTGGNTGTYTFSGTANCVTANGAQTSTPVLSSGTYNNIQCGTGTAVGSVSVTGIGSFSYSITFAAGQGVLTATSPGDQGGGPVTIVPQPGGCVTGPVTQFTVAGELTGIIS